MRAFVFCILSFPLFASANELDRRSFLGLCPVVLATGIPGLGEGSVLRDQIAQRSHELLEAGYLGNPRIREAFASFMETDLSGRARTLVLTGATATGKTYLVRTAQKVWGLNRAESRHYHRTSWEIFLPQPSKHGMSEFVSRFPPHIPEITDPYDLFFVIGHAFGGSYLLEEAISNVKNFLENITNTNQRILLSFDHFHKIPSEIRHSFIKELWNLIDRQEEHIRRNVRVVFLYTPFVKDEIDSEIHSRDAWILDLDRILALSTN